VDKSVKDEIKGKAYRIVHCLGALESFQEALGHVDARKHSTFRRGMVQQIQRLADGHKMTKENFPREGELPKKGNGESAGYFHAFKRISVRGYCWRSKRLENTWFISRYVYKDYQKLKVRDTERLGKNWTRIEMNGNER
jgi:hypothetical protein